MRVTVDQDKCVSSGQCVLNASDVFDQRDDDGVVMLLVAHPGAELAEGTRKAAAACPALAIDIEE
ncbi:MAG TPA: ferredoxin [Mycobacterium sp.]